MDAEDEAVCTCRNEQVAKAVAQLPALLRLAFRTWEATGDIAHLVGLLGGDAEDILSEIKLPKEEF